MRPYPQIKGFDYVDHSESKEKRPLSFSYLLIECWKINFAELILLYCKRRVSPVTTCGFFPKSRVFTNSLFFVDSLCRPFSLWACGDHRLEIMVLENVYLIPSLICLPSQESGMGNHWDLTAELPRGFFW